MFDAIGTGAPYLYDYINSANAVVDPSTVHVTNTGLNRYFQKYLMQKAITIFDWKLPENWSKDYFLYVLYCWGFVGVFDAGQYGVIPQGCSLRGHNIFYQPTHIVLSNPLLREIKERQIGVDCTLIKLQPVYSGILDIVDYYANLMTLTTETLGTNLVNSKLAYVFGAETKAQAESFKKMFDDISSGEPAVFIDKKLFDDQGRENWFSFSQDLKGNYLADELLSDLRKIEAMFDTEVGIPNANTDKRERMVVDEVNANNFETQSKAQLWLETLQKGVNETNGMFGLNISVDWREELKNDELVIDSQPVQQ